MERAGAQECRCRRGARECRQARRRTGGGGGRAKDAQAHRDWLFIHPRHNSIENSHKRRLRFLNYSTPSEKLHSRDFRPQAPSVHQHQARSRYICVRPNPSQHHAQISLRAVSGRDLNHLEGKLNCEEKLNGRQRGPINLKPFFP